MKPYKTFLFFLSVLFVFAVVSWCLGGVRLVFFDRFTITFPAWGNARQERLVSSASVPEEAVFESSADHCVGEALDTDSLPSTMQGMPSLSSTPTSHSGESFEIPEGEEHALYVFFRRLMALEDSRSSAPLRVLHYGDSQIEGDRISASIREGFQRDFGGTGPGLLPLFSSVTMGSYGVDMGRQWEKTTVLDPLPRPNYGATMGVLQPSAATAQLYFKRAPKLAYARALHYDQVRLLTHNGPDSPWKIRCFDDSLHYSNRQNEGRFSLEMYYNRNEWTRGELWCSSPSAKLYGIALDGMGGVAVDNIPLRGSPGYIFQKSEREALRESFSLLNVGMVIYQFGVNAVPNSSERMSNARAFEEAMTAQLLHLRRSLPQIPVVVIGVSDRAIKEEGTYKTNPNVYLVRDAQRRAAQRAGCIFWDLFQAMGGETAIVGWLHQNPALAGKDLTHFTPAGARRVGELFYQAFHQAYSDFCQREKNLGV